jgi:putative ABC transport system ATP-binding protein
VIRCIGVHKSYRLATSRSGEQIVHALRGVDLEIAEPGFYAIMGASGSGKSTLLHLLAALDRPDSGEIYLNNEPIHALSERDATTFRRTKIGIVFQQFNLIPTLTARENVELPGTLAGDNPAKLAARSRELLDRLGLSGRDDHRPDALSGGEQQRVAIARALLYSPPILFADEPTGNLDSASSATLWRLLRELADSANMSIVMVTHEPAAAANCRRAYILADGRVKASFDTSGLDAPTLAQRYQDAIRP